VVWIKGAAKPQPVLHGPIRASDLSIQLSYMIDVPLAFCERQKQHVEFVRCLPNDPKRVLKRSSKQLELHRNTLHCQGVRKEQQLPRNLHIAIFHNIQFADGFDLGWELVNLIMSQKFPRLLVAALTSRRAAGRVEAELSGGTRRQASRSSA